MFIFFHSERHCFLSISTPWPPLPSNALLKFYFLTIFILFVAPNCHSKATNIFLSSCIFFLFFIRERRRIVVLALPPIIFLTLPLIFHGPVVNVQPHFKKESRVFANWRAAPEVEKRVERGSGARRQFSTPADNFSPNFFIFSLFFLTSRLLKKVL